MLLPPTMSKTIYVSIASYMDQELYATVDSLFRNAKRPKNIFLSVFSQDITHPDLQPIFDEFGIKSFQYDKINYVLSRGVGFARAHTQKKLSPRYRYYLQVDSHTRFEQDWDTRLINDYEVGQRKWGKYIYSSYPPGYEYKNNKVVFIENDRIPPAVEIKPTLDFRHFEAKYCNYVGGTQGQLTGYFCAGLAFGYTNYFLEVPYDPNIYFQGEEQTMSVRFFEKGTKIVAPHDLYLYHDYVGTKRKRQWETNTSREQMQKNSEDRVDLILRGYMRDKYSLDLESFIMFSDTYIK